MQMTTFIASRNEREEGAEISLFKLTTNIFFISFVALGNEYGLTVDILLVK
jgi:hypothetical protein